MQTVLAFFIPRLAWAYLYFVGKTSRIHWLHKNRRYHLEKSEKNFIYAFWHGRQVFIVYAYRDLPVTALISQSKDGEYIARILELFGEKAIRGSSSRGGLKALAELKKEIDSGRIVGLTPDGPRGPQRSVAEGILYLAQKTGKPILPLAYSAKRKLIFHGWDDYWVPLPFNYITLSLGKTVMVTSSDSLQEKSEELKRALNETTEESDRGAELGRAASEAVAYFIYNLLVAVLSPVLLVGIFLRYPKTFLSHFADGLRDRFAFFEKDRFKNLNHPVWIHASSLGECRAALPFVTALKEKHPDETILFTCTTPNGVDEARKLRLGDAIQYAPIDCPFTLNRLLNAAQPRMLLLLESELWPNWLSGAKSHGIPVGLINGRMSQRSAGRYQKFNQLSRILFEKIDFAAVREQNDLERYAACGMKKDSIVVTGNLKYDLAPWEFNGGDSLHRSSEQKKLTLWVAGSVRGGEENLILETHRNLLKLFPDMKLIFAPRHIDRLGPILKLMQSMKLEFTLRSQSAGNQFSNILVWDTFGDLWKAYEMAGIVFVGGSLVPKGGQNPIEPAWFQKPILFGPWMDNFEEPAKMLLTEKAAIQVQDRNELEEKISYLIRNPESANTIGINSRVAMDRYRGLATEKTLALVERYLYS